MRKILSIALVLSGAFFFLAIFPENAHAQFTTVTATVTDPNGIPYAAGTMSAILTPSAPGGFRLNGQPYSGRVGPATLDATGKFTANFGDVTLITPSAQWQITVNSNPGGILPPLGTGGQTIIFTSTGTTISGGSPVDISTSLNALAPKLTNFAGSGSGSVTSVSATAPIVATPSPIIGVGTISCPTCNTTGATIAGSIATTQIPFGTSANTIGGANVGVGTGINFGTGAVLPVASTDCTTLNADKVLVINYANVCLIPHPTTLGFTVPWTLGTGSALNFGFGGVSVNNFNKDASGNVTTSLTSLGVTGSLAVTPLLVTQYPTIPTSDLFIGTTGGAAGNASITGTQSVGIGFNALVSMTAPASGGLDSQDTALGYNACHSVTTARYSLCIGSNAGASLTGNGQGVEDGVNTFIGTQAGQAFTGSTANQTHIVCVGEDSCLNLTAGFNGVFLGDHSGAGVVTCTVCTIIGGSAASNVANTMTSSNDVIIGYQAALAGTGIFATNVIIGAAAAIGTTATNSEVLIGANAAFSQTTATQSVCVGYNTCRDATTGSSNVAVGYQAAQHQLGFNMVAIGNQACQAATGSGNTINTCIGENTALGGVNDTNETVLGGGVTGAGSNTATIGNASVTDAYFGSSTPTAIVHGKGFNTATNCSSSASPAVCGSASAGSVAVPTGTNATLVVNTTAVTANSQIFVQSDDTLGTKLSVTCNSTLASLIVEPVVTARTGGTSFTITISGTTTTNPVCLSYFIVN